MSKMQIATAEFSRRMPRPCTKWAMRRSLARRMSGFSNFAVSFSIICILAGGITSFQVGFSTGGGFTAIIGWIVGGIFAMVVGCSMAQIASAYPTAGGLYHWSSILGGRGWGWVTAWFNLLGLIFVIASVNVGVYSLFTGLILGNIFGINTASWGLCRSRRWRSSSLPSRRGCSIILALRRRRS